MDGEDNHNWIGLRNCSTTLLDAVQWQCNTNLNEQKPIQNNPSPSIEGLGPLPTFCHPRLQKNIITIHVQSSITGTTLLERGHQPLIYSTNYITDGAVAVAAGRESAFWDLLPAVPASPLTHLPIFCCNSFSHISVVVQQDIFLV